MIAKKSSAWGLGWPSIGVVVATALGFSSAVRADTWTGGFMGRSGIVWAYNVQVDGTFVKLTIRGDSDGKKVEAACADTSLDASNTFEASCRYIGGNFHFKVRAQLTSDFHLRRVCGG